MGKDGGSTNVNGSTHDFCDPCDAAHAARTASVVARYEADPTATQEIDKLILAHLHRHETTRRDRAMSACAREERVEAIKNQDQRVQHGERCITDFGDSEINLCAEIEEQAGVPQQTILERIDALASQDLIHFDEDASSDCGQTILRAGPPPNGCATFRRRGGFWVRSATGTKQAADSGPPETQNASVKTRPDVPLHTLAMAILFEEPDIAPTELAKRVGVSRGTLYQKSDKWNDVRLTLVARDTGRISRGSKNANGSIEACDEDRELHPTDDDDSR